MEIYVKVRDGVIERTTCLGHAVTVEFDAHDRLLGIEVIGANGLEIDGVEIPQEYLAFARHTAERFRDIQAPHTRNGEH